MNNTLSRGVVPCLKGKKEGRKRVKGTARSWPRGKEKCALYFTGHNRTQERWIGKSPLQSAVSNWQAEGGLDFVYLFAYRRPWLAYKSTSRMLRWMMPWSTRSGIKSKHDKIWATLVLRSSRLNDPPLGNYFLMLLSEISNCMARSLVSVVPFWILVSEILLTRQIWKFLKIVESRIIIFPFVFPFLKIFKFYHEVSLFLICSELNFAQGNRHFQYRIEYLLFSKSWNIFVNTSLRFFRNL